MGRTTDEIHTAHAAQSLASEGLLDRIPIKEERLLKFLVSQASRNMDLRVPPKGIEARVIHARR